MTTNKATIKDTFLIIRNLSILALIFIVVLTVILGLFLYQNELIFIGKICFGLTLNICLMAILNIIFNKET